MQHTQDRIHFCIFTIASLHRLGIIFNFWIHHKKGLYNFDPLKPSFYIVKLGFTGVYIIFLILLKNTACGYSLELPHRGGSNKYPQSML